MNKKYIIRKNEEIVKTIHKAKKYINKYYIIYYLKNSFGYNRYCVSVSKKIGKAHTRNLYKRRIKNILMKNNLNNSYDCVIILRNAILDIEYTKMESELVKFFKGDK